MKKLLITLGCSWTEGVGIYKKDINGKTDYIQDSNYMHENSWPNNVGKKLGFDKVVNLGEGKGSHSSQVKKFYEYISNNDISNCQVLVIFLMTDPIRISFYKNHSIKSYSMSDINNPLMKSYVNEIDDTLWDCLLEQKFYVESLENICKLNKIDLILTSWNDSYTQFRKIHNTKNHLFKSTLPIKPSIKNNYSYCGHPNQNGYEWLSNKIIDGIKENFKKWYSFNYKNEIEWVWIKTSNHNMKSLL